MGAGSMSNVVITLRPDGPLCIVGAIEIRDIAGNLIELDQSEGRYFLCRCGRSKRKPFCDGTHKRTGWREAEVPTIAGSGDVPPKEGQAR